MKKKTMRLVCSKVQGSVYIGSVCWSAMTCRFPYSNSSLITLQLRHGSRGMPLCSRWGSSLKGLREQVLSKYWARVQSSSSECIRTPQWGSGQWSVGFFRKFASTMLISWPKAQKSPEFSLKFLSTPYKTVLRLPSTAVSHLNSLQSS